MKGEAVEMELRGGHGLRGIGEPQRIETGRGQTLQLANARIGALENGCGRELLAQDADAGVAHACGEQAFGQELQHDELAVLVGDEAGQLVGLAEAEAAGVVGGVEHRFAAGDGRAQARLRAARAMRLGRERRARRGAERFATKDCRAPCRATVRGCRPQAGAFLLVLEE